MSDKTIQNPLCCCEYIDRDNERNHILGCCCNCVDLDQAADRLFRCQSVTQSQKTNMLLTLQDRIRAPWFGGAKRVATVDVIPILVLPAMLYTAAISLYCSVVIFLAMAAFLFYMYFHLRRTAPRSKFFFLWTIWSILFLWILFESTVPMLELLPEENVAFLLLLSISLFFLYKTKQFSQSCQAGAHSAAHDATDEDSAALLTHDEPEDAELGSNVCQLCRKRVPQRTFHCTPCQTCVVRQDHHNVWLDCCIGASNHRYYLLGCVLGLLTLLFGANLSLTSICHPFLIANVLGVHVLMPDDCTDVYDQYDIAVCFVGSVYALAMATCMALALLQQIFFISRGVTGTEWRRGELSGQRRHCCTNWRNFLCGK
ncbi:palmitoyltransferase ZDHHC23-B-like [Phlebotomus argentipes]|uniref:palmitoyltransferase ZDHHC23-B-like n=1 Tax=Phlebotomus argentipes TaxID=94469 RepID=UPI002892A318|nr:palmitoyltransferase ZDHHC23-B-like [Phlebotomus argentipes]XP_059620708.1 palmitoyltransferase ZDHHC23-B-like [Phlebotomus argentipes]